MFKHAKIKFRKSIVVFLFALTTTSLFAQTLIDPGFDSVYIGGIDRIHHWIPSSASPFYIIQDTVLAQAPDSCYNWVDPWLLHPVGLIYNQATSGFGIKLTTTSLLKENQEPFETFIVNGSQSYKTGSDGYIAFEHSGEPFTGRPSAMEGWYQFFDTIPQTIDYGRCMVLLKKYNQTTNQSDTIAYGEQLLGATSNWTEYQVPLQYRSNAVPDSIVVLFFASTNPQEFGELWLDEISFDYTLDSQENLLDNNQFTTIYPNPNSGTIQIKGSINYTSYQLIALDGRLLSEDRFSPTIDVSSIQQKVFILQLFDDKLPIKAFKIIKH